MKSDETRPHFSALRGSARSLASCPGYTDADGSWNTGFQCPKWGTEDDEYCCGDATKRFCCPSPPKPKHHGSYKGSGRKSVVDKDDGGLDKSGKGDRKKERYPDMRTSSSRHYNDRHKGNKHNEKFNFMLDNPGILERPPSNDELFRTGRITSLPLDEGQSTHSIDPPPNPIVQLPVIPLVLTLSIVTFVLLLGSLVACCCCCVLKKKRRSKQKENYVKTTSVNLEAEVTSAAIAAQAMVMMPGSDSFYTSNSNNNTNNHIYNTNNNPNNLYNNNNVSNMSNNTLSTTSSMSAVYNNIACRGPPSMQMARGSPEINSSDTGQNKLHHLHIASYGQPPMHHDQHTPVISGKESALHWQELESMLVSHEKATMNDVNSINELSSSITNWLPLSKSQLGPNDSCINKWVSDSNNQQLPHSNNNSSNNDSMKSSHKQLLANVFNSNNNNKNHESNATDFNSLNNCSVSFHANHSCLPIQAQTAVSPFPDVTQTSVYKPSLSDISPSHHNFSKVVCNSNSLKRANKVANNSPCKQHADEHRHTHTRAHTQANIQPDKELSSFSSKNSLPDIPDCPQLKLASTWMAMR